MSVPAFLSENRTTWKSLKNQGPTLTEPRYRWRSSLRAGPARELREHGNTLPVPCGASLDRLRYMMPSILGSQMLPPGVIWPNHLNSVSTSQFPQPDLPQRSWRNRAKWSSISLSSSTYSPVMVSRDSPSNVSLRNARMQGLLMRAALAQ